MKREGGDTVSPGNRVEAGDESAGSVDRIWAKKNEKCGSSGVRTHASMRQELKTCVLDHSTILPLRAEKKYFPDHDWLRVVYS